MFAQQAFTLTNALATHILLVTHVALAAVAGRCGNAAPVQAEVGEMLANVDCLVQGGCSLEGKKHTFVWMEVCRGLLRTISCSPNNHKNSTMRTATSQDVQTKLDAEERTLGTE